MKPTLEELDALHAAATPGEWRWDELDERVETASKCPVASCAWPRDEQDADGLWIAQSHNAYPTLARVIRAAEAMYLTLANTEGNCVGPYYEERIAEAIATYDAAVKGQ